jgi:hypothetical protein
MNASAVLQAVRGPVVLITLGVLIAADHFGVAAFWRTWPVLLIVFGVMKLLETLARRPAEENRGNLP